MIHIPAMTLHDNHVHIDGYGTYELIPKGIDGKKWVPYNGANEEVPTVIWNVVWGLRDLMGYAA